MVMVQKRPVFTGFEDAYEWLEHFEHVTTLMEWSEDMLVDGFPLCMRDVAEDWYHWIAGQSWEKLKKAMLYRFGHGCESELDDAQEELSTSVLQVFHVLIRHQ